MSETDNVPAVTGTIDFQKVIDKALVIFKEQSLVDEDITESDLLGIELKKAKANSFLDSINNLISMSHTIDLVTADKHKFSREKELLALNPLLDSFKLSAEACKSSVVTVLKSNK